jgi:hypothetical protein
MAAMYLSGSLKVDKSRDMLLEGDRPRIDWAWREREGEGGRGRLRLRLKQASSGCKSSRAAVNDVNDRQTDRQTDTARRETAAR